MGTPSLSEFTCSLPKCCASRKVRSAPCFRKFSSKAGRHPSGVSLRQIAKSVSIAFPQRAVSSSKPDGQITAACTKRSRRYSAALKRSSMNDIFRRILYLLNRRRFEQELADDMEFHREMATQAGNPNF